VFVHDPAIRRAALDLIAEGLNDCDVSRRIGVPHRTVRDWRVPSYVPRGDPHVCWRCKRRTAPVVFTPPDYAELLGLYLGDGHVSRLARTERIRLMLDTKYPTIVEEGCRPVGSDRAAKQGRPPVSARGTDGHAPRLLQPLDMPSPAARARQEARPADRPRAVCAHVGVECRVYARHVRVYRRASVALMLEHVGRKN
jgi:Homeodomain-like domain